MTYNGDEGPKLIIKCKTTWSLLNSWRHLHITRPLFFQCQLNKQTNYITGKETKKFPTKATLSFRKTGFVSTRFVLD